MAKTKILQRDSPILRETARSIAVKDIRSERIRTILDKMKKALHAEEDGVAIAAPQVGESLRMFVVNGKVIASPKDLVFINPEIIKASKKKREMEEGCLSVRYLYGKVKRSEKVTVRAYDEKGSRSERGASGLLAQIFQHETDHLDGILFIDKAKNIRDLPPSEDVRFVFFGGSRFSDFVLEELERTGLSPILKISSARDPLPIEKLKEIKADVFVVASFGKILPKEVIELPKRGALNVHPSLLPKLRGPSPIQTAILDNEAPGVTIIRMDEKMDHGPIITRAEVIVSPWPDHYRIAEEKLGRAGGKILGALLPKWRDGKLQEAPQDEDSATYTKLIKKEDGLLNLESPAEENLRKVLAYSTWPGAYMFFKNKTGKKIRVVVKDAMVKEGVFCPVRIIPEGKREMGWQDFLRGNQ